MAATRPTQAKLNTVHAIASCGCEFAGRIWTSARCSVYGFGTAARNTTPGNVISAHQRSAQLALYRAS